MRGVEAIIDAPDRSKDMERRHSIAWILLALASHASPFLLRVEALPSAWESRGLGGGGAQYAPSISPFDRGEIYVACDMSEIFHTTQNGLSWETVDFRELQGGRLARVQFTSDPAVRYCVNYRRALYAPSRSADGGQTWTLLPAAAWPTNRPCFSLWCDPGSTTRLFAASQTGLYFSADGGGAFQLLTNFVGSGAPAGSFPGLRVGGAFFAGNDLVVAWNRGLLVSTNGGSSFFSAPWSGLPDTESILSCAGAREGTATRLFCLTALTNAVYPDPNGLPYAAFRGLYVLDPGQTTWVSRVAGLPTNETYGLIGMCPTNNQIVYLSGRSTNYPYARMYRSSDAGSNWLSILHIPTNVVSGWAGLPAVSKVNWAAPEGLAVDPHDPDHVVITDNGFTHQTTNGGAIWHQLYVDPATENPTNTVNPQSKSYQGVGFEPTVPVWLEWLDATNLLAGFSDLRLAKSYDAGRTWNFDYTGMTNDEVYHIVVHPTSGVVYADNQGATSPYMILGLDDASTDRRFGPVMMSTNRGLTWSTLKHWSGVPVWETLDPSDPETLYVALMNSSNGGLYVTHNLSAGTNASWFNLGRHSRANGRAYNVRVLNDGTVVMSHSCRKLNNGSYEQSSGVFVLPPGGGAWVDRSHTNMTFWTQDVVVDPWDVGQSNWFATVWNTGTTGSPDPTTVGGLYHTTDRGLSWARLWSNGSAQSVTISPVNSNELYLTTMDQGLWHSTDFRSPAPTFTAVTNYPFRHPYRVFFNPYHSNEVWITSNGNGLRVGVYSNWTLTITAGTNGTTIPAGPTSIYDGMPAQVQIQPDLYYHVLEVTTNGSSAGAVSTLAWSAISGDLAVTAQFEENRSVQGTPHWWLAAYGFATNDAAADSDPDNDGFPAWQEYIAATSPTNGASFFQVLELSTAPFPSVGKIIAWTGRADRVYEVWLSTNLLQDPHPLASGLPGLDGLNQWTDTVERTWAGYRVRVAQP